MTATFVASRSDGRSDRVVVFELVADADPDTTFSYDTLTAALADGLGDAEVDRPRVYRAVAQANTTLLRERSRYLDVVRDEGYRVVKASEHAGVALKKKSQADAAMRRGMQILRGVRMEELSEMQRAAHQGTLMIVGSLIQMSRESERRHDRSEQLIAELKAGQSALSRRIDDLETQ